MLYNYNGTSIARQCPFKVPEGRVRGQHGRDFRDDAEADELHLHRHPLHGRILRGQGYRVKDLFFVNMV